MTRSIRIGIPGAILPQVLSGQSVQANQEPRYCPVHSASAPERQIVNALDDRAQNQGNEHVTLTGSLHRSGVSSSVQFISELRGFLRSNEQGGKGRRLEYDFGSLRGAAAVVDEWLAESIQNDTADPGSSVRHLSDHCMVKGATGSVYRTAIPEGNAWRCWQSNGPWIGSSFPGYSKSRVEYRQLPGASNAAATWFDYDTKGNLIMKLEYDWASVPDADVPSCSVSGIVLRKTESRYWNPPGAALSVAKAADALTIGPANAIWKGEQSFRRIVGYKDVWALKAILDRSQPAKRNAVACRDYEPPLSTSHCVRDTVPSRAMRVRIGVRGGSDGASRVCSTGGLQ
ncbi:MAG: hypothetical protein JNN08_20765 [Bryobacterales bacterium]|nr:hypothetical protein [Bryobacterales bacterium]